MQLGIPWHPHVIPARTYLQRGLRFLLILGFSTPNALFCHPVAVRDVRKEAQFTCKPVSPARKVLCCIVLNAACQHRRANRSVKVPVPLVPSHLWLEQISPVTAGSHSDSTQSRHVTYPALRFRTLTAPAGAQKWQLMLSSVSQDPSDTETLTGPDVDAVSKVMAWSQTRVMLTSSSP